MLNGDFPEDRPTKTGRTPFRAAIVTVLIGALWIVGGCDRGLTDVLTVVNNTNQVVHFEIVTVQGTPFQLSKTANPGETVGCWRAANCPAGPVSCAIAARLVSSGRSAPMVACSNDSRHRSAPQATS